MTLKGKGKGIDFGLSISQPVVHWYNRERLQFHRHFHAFAGFNKTNNTESGSAPALGSAIVLRNACETTYKKSTHHS